MSIKKMRWLFVLFFLALIVPSSILSFKAHQQLRWQTFHQFQLDAQALTSQIDRALSNMIDKEEARADTDYTFFVLAGTPEAKLVQRSELSKFPVEADLVGVIGYFQIDEDGNFSSPVLPSEYVQSAVHPGLYGISVEENQRRSELVKSIKKILLKNQLVASKPLRSNGSSVNGTGSLSSQSSEDVITTASGISEEKRKDKSPKLSDGLTFSEKVETSVATEFNQGSDVSEIEVELDGDKKQLNSSSEKANPRSESPRSLVDLSFDKQSKLRKQDSEKNVSINQAKFKAKQSVRSRASEKKEASKRYETEPFSQLAKKAELRRVKRSRDNRSKAESAPSRQGRMEKNYSPQQTLVTKENAQLAIESERIQIKLFESEIEPFKFSLLESGDFVLYRQVWREQGRIIQGAIVSSDQFLQQAIQQYFVTSGLYQTTQLNLFYGTEFIRNIGQFNAFKGGTTVEWKQANDLRGELLTSVSLSEPFSSFSLDFRVVKLPNNSSSIFIKFVAASLFVVLLLGTYFLYRLTLKQTQLARQQQDFVSSVSHELKTPLTSIRMYGEILKQGWVSDEKKEEYYDYIYTESERLSRLIANVLQISKVNHNALELNLVLVNISELVSLIHSKVDSQIAQSQFELDIFVEPQLKNQAILVDSDAFVQIIINLVDNAIKYAASATDKRIDIGFKSDTNNAIRVSVRDYGPGIARSQLKNIFELFYRSGDELTREVAGTGIGLALVKQLSLAMSANVVAKNHSKGVEFTIFFVNEKTS
jgi:signal transduction histidine kinase